MPRRTHIDIGKLRALDACEDIEQLSDAITRLLAPLHIEYWYYAVDLPLVNEHPNQLHFGTYPDEWVKHYFEQDFIRIDPVISHCHDRAVPLTWQEAQRHQARVVDPQLHKVRRLFNEAREAGLGSGISIPLHGPGVTWGLMSYASPNLEERDFVALLPELHLMAHFVHEAARRIGRATVGETLPTLTRRERECLAWAAAGKTRWEIGQVLNISERTVIFHLQNATQKLGVSGRQAAIARAVQLGLVISPRV